MATMPVAVCHIYLAFYPTFHLAFLLTFYLAYFLTFYLSYFLIFYLGFYLELSIWNIFGSLSSVIFDILSGILSLTSSDILCGISYLEPTSLC